MHANISFSAGSSANAIQNTIVNRKGSEPKMGKTMPEVRKLTPLSSFTKKRSNKIGRKDER